MKKSGISSETKKDIKSNSSTGALIDISDNVGEAIIFNSLDDAIQSGAKIACQYKKKTDEGDWQEGDLLEVLKANIFEGLSGELSILLRPRIIYDPKLNDGLSLDYLHAIDVAFKCCDTVFPFEIKLGKNPLTKHGFKNKYIQGIGKTTINGKTYVIGTVPSILSRQVKGILPDYENGGQEEYPFFVKETKDVEEAKDKTGLVLHSSWGFIGRHDQIKQFLKIEDPDKNIPGLRLLIDVSTLPNWETSVDKTLLELSVLYKNTFKPSPKSN